MEKARSVCSQSAEPELVLCAAHDVPSSSNVLSKEELEQILRINFSSSKHQGSLPGFLPLYIGMPVILRMRNLSTDLKITNGAQGYVRKIALDISPQGLTYCSCAIVEFPDSPVKLEGLPQGHFPITPVTFSFTATFTRERDGQTEKLKFSRHQLPIQPGFAVTGQSAQGKTLPKVLVNLHEGGFGSYVAASRAKSRNGLCITQAVRLNDLNKPLPHDLFVEVHRLGVLEKNTLVHHGFSSGVLLPVPDPESEVEVAKDIVKIKVVDPESSSSKKRKMDDRDESGPNVSTLYSENNISSNSVGPKKKRQKKLLNSSSSNSDVRQRPTESNDPSSSPRSPLLSAGCRWTPESWSCAYDSVFMSLYGIYASSAPQFRQDFRSISVLTDNLARSYEVLSHPRSHTNTMFNHHRDKLRDSLSAISPGLFPRFGHFGACVSSIIDIAFPRSTRKLIILPSCPHGCSLSRSIPISEGNFPSVIIPPEMQIGGATQHSVDQYLSDFLVKASENWDNSINLPNQMTCQQCDSVLSSISAAFFEPPPLLFFEVPPGSSVSPSLYIKAPSLHCEVSYRLTAVIYLGGYHFTCRLIIEDGTIWKHDGQDDNGRPCLDVRILALPHILPEISFLDFRKAHFYIYSRVDN
jgi:hypothetical protein